MYPTHWGLRESPFRGRFDEQFFYHQSQTHEEALAAAAFFSREPSPSGIAGWDRRGAVNRCFWPFLPDSCGGAG